MDNRIIIIDGNSLINRAYYAMQRPMITRDGVYTQGIYGFLNILSKIEKDYPSGYIVVAFDRKAPTFRHKEYTEYKAGRKQMPPELAMEFPILKDILDALKIKRLEIDGFEADDIIGTVARLGEEQGLEPFIITGDRDQLQLASDVTKVLFTKRGISDFDLYDKAAFIEEYGFTPQQFIDYKGLMGDPSDNIPGLPGVGKKTAQKLIIEYGSVSNLLANVDSLPKGKLKSTIEENYTLASMSRRLAKICLNVPIDVDFEEFKLEEPDYESLIEIYKKLEFNSFLKRLKLPENFKKMTSSAEDIPDVCLLQYFVSDESHLMDILNGINGVLTIKTLNDGNHKKTPEIYALGFAIDGKCFCLTDCALIRVFARAVSENNILLGGHDIKNDVYTLMYYGLKNASIAFDTAIAQYVLDSSRSNYTIKAMAFEYFNNEISEESEVLNSAMQLDMFSDNAEKLHDYITEFLNCVCRLKPVVENQVDRNGLSHIYRDIELPLIEVMASMEKNGFGINGNILTETGKKLAVEINDLSEKIFSYANHEFNINSPKQLGEVLFDEMSLPAGKKTKKGYSTSAEVLEKIKDRHPIVPMILEYRTLTKLNGTYVEGLVPLINEDGRIHAHFQQTVTATGRISCTEPNLQNIPIRQSFGRQLRKAFVPASGCKFVGADYSQIELRVLASMSGDEELIDAFNRGDDIHKITASRVLGVPEDEITSEQRSAAKAINFGVIYGMSGFGLSNELNITRKDAQKYINDYFEKYTAVKAFMDRQKEFCRENGYIETIMGRKRYINEITASNFMVRQLGERLAMNSPIQGSAADIIKLAMIKVFKKLNEGGYKSKLVLQIHDELIIETYEDEIDEIKSLLKYSMESAVKLSVNLSADLNVGDDWYQLK